MRLFSKGFFQTETSRSGGCVSHSPAPGHDAALHPSVPTSGLGCMSSMGLVEGEGVALHPGLNLVSTVHFPKPQSRWRP